MTLQSLARDQLDRTTVTISAPSGFPGSVWNEEERAFYKVNVNAGYGDSFRDVRVRFQVGYPHIIDPLVWGGTPLWDGDELYDVLDTGHKIQFYVRVKAKAAGTIHAWVSVTAEAVPATADGHIAHRSDTITPL